MSLVAQYSLIHDAPEVYAGDTQTLLISDEERADKARREQAAARRLDEEFRDRLPWLARTVANYERQDTPEARFVRGVDKLLPQIAHWLDGCRSLLRQQVSAADLVASFTRQHIDMSGYVGEFDALMALHADLVGRVISRHQIAIDQRNPVA